MAMPQAASSMATGEARPGVHLRGALAGGQERAFGELFSVMGCPARWEHMGDWAKAVTRGESGYKQMTIFGTYKIPAPARSASRFAQDETSFSEKPVSSVNGFKLD